MTPESRKTFNTVIGTLLIILAFLCFGLTAYMVVVPNESKDLPPPKISPVPKQPCVNGLKELGFRVDSPGPNIVASDVGMQVAPIEKLRMASLGISMCHYYLKSFCMGSACKTPGMTFELMPEASK